MNSSTFPPAMSARRSLQRHLIVKRIRATSVPMTITQSTLKYYRTLPSPELARVAGAPTRSEHGKACADLVLWERDN
jgi:hypothetical protein